MAVARSAGFDVVVVGGANTDYVVEVPSLPCPGETVRGRELLCAPGGKGANQAVASARLGARVAFVGRVGADDRGHQLLEALRREDVDVSAVIEDPSAPTGAALVVVDGTGQKQIATAPGANRALGVADVERAREVIANTRVLLVQLEPPLDTVDAAVHLGRAGGARVVLDPAPPEALGEDLLTLVHVIRPNASEAEALTNERVEDEASARRAARNLLARGVGAACVGAPGGNLLATGAGERWLPHLPVKAVDATGAGDAFAAGLAVALAEGQTLEAAALLASAAAALATTRLGAQAALPRREQVTALLRG